MSFESGQTPAFDVSGAVAILNQVLDTAVPNMVVVGELASFKVAKNRWVYADIKDDGAKMRLFGSIYDLPGPMEDGMMIEVFGRPQMHPQFGFSLNIMAIRPVGEGSIKKASDLLKQKLEKEGLFDSSRKRSVPYPPVRIGLVTSVESAAYADFIKILNARWQGVEVEVYDSQVQGDAATDSVISGIQYFNQHTQPPEAIVLIRGGGSADDLATFSVEQVVRAVSASRVPTVVAIGHEVDESLAELAADMQASTPSNAAELLFPSRSDVRARLQLTHRHLSEQVTMYLDAKTVKLQREGSDLSRFVARSIDQRLEELQQSSALLEAVHPRATLKRGYALVQISSGKLVSSKSQLKEGDALRVSLADGAIDTKVEKVY